MLEPAQAAQQLADEMIAARRFAEALEPARQACRLLPESGDAWWNLAIAAKHAHAWSDCLQACERSLALTPEPGAGAWWNLAIAATALRDWPTARQAWSHCNIEVPDGQGALRLPLGHACVRISPAAESEVVFCERVDPCRAQILSVPLPDCDRRFGDVVLHDGERRGTQRYSGVELAVFDELTLFERSDYGTWQVRAECRDATSRDQLLARFDGVDGAIEDWTESVSILCKWCSLGEPHESHEPDAEGPWQAARTLGLAVRDERELKRLRGFPWGWIRGVRDVTRVL